MPGTGQVTPESDEAPAGENGQGSRDQHTADAAIVAAERDPVKWFATLQAAAALRGIVVQRIAGDTGAEYIVSQQGGAYCARRFSLDALAGLLQRMGVRLP
jgi:hypothetical protein